MSIKRILCPERLRKIPRQFSWIDHRLVRDRHIRRVGHQALALYLFLVTVADAEGISYYGDVSICRLLSFQPAQLIDTRRELSAAGFIAYERPLYQVLSLDRPPTTTSVLPPGRVRPQSNETRTIGEILFPPKEATP